jgi:hypothetical protein
MQVQYLDAYLQLEPTSAASEKVHQAREAASKLFVETKGPD